MDHLIDSFVHLTNISGAYKHNQSNQSILKEINLEYSMEGLLLKLKRQYFGHQIQSQPIGKNPDAGKD